MKKIFLGIGLIVIIGLIVVQIAGQVRDWQISKVAQRLTQQAKEAETRAKSAEERATALASDLEASRMKLAEADARAQASEDALRFARNITVRIKEDYATTRSRPVADYSADVRELCAKLAALGYSCTPAR